MQFRANGGPMGEMPMAPPPMDPAMMAPPPMDPAMMAPPPMDPAMMAPPAPDPSQELMATEQMANAGGEGIGALFADQVATALESAEEPKEVIDAIRGNDVPLESRYQELADYVGEEDALATPPSVLTMVQPTIMMTEEGAVNSGIGDLMQNITEGVEMETAEGEATPMAEGVGSLMMGVEQPLTQNFRHGGPVVQRFNNGGEGISNNPFGTDMVKNIKEGYQSFLPTYLEAVDLDAAKDAAQANLLFNIAQTGLAFAGGVSPEGVPLTGSPAQKLAQVTANLPAAAAQATAGVREAEQKAKIGALGAAQAASDRAADAFVAQQLKNQEIQAQKIMQRDKFDFEKGKYISSQQHEKALRDAQAVLSRELKVLEGNNSLKGIEAQGKVSKELAELNAKLELTRQKAVQEDVLERLDVEQLHNIEKIQTEGEIRTKIQDGINKIQQGKLDLDRIIADRRDDLDKKIFKKDSEFNDRKLELESQGLDIQNAQVRINEAISKRKLDLEAQGLAHKIANDDQLIKLEGERLDLQNKNIEYTRRQNNFNNELNTKRLELDKELGIGKLDLDARTATWNQTNQLSLIELQKRETAIKEAKANYIQRMIEGDKAQETSYFGGDSLVDAIESIAAKPENIQASFGDLKDTFGWANSLQATAARSIDALTGGGNFLNMAETIGGSEARAGNFFKKLNTDATFFLRSFIDGRSNLTLDKKLIASLPKVGFVSPKEQLATTGQIIKRIEQEIKAQNDKRLGQAADEDYTGYQETMGMIGKLNDLRERYGMVYLAGIGGRGLEATAASAPASAPAPVEDNTGGIIDELRANEQTN
tara:strand:+ start:72 stop:2537 length:2466 start_codon:yes stop_codon:yes gene_type:complete